MTARPMDKMIRQLRQSALAPDGGDLSDGRLLDRFRRQGDGAAFAALVRRHGPMVWGVCRRILAGHQDAEDAFQATFLVLVRKAASVVRQDLLAGWLYGVAYRTARKGRALAARRRARERQVVDMPEPVAARQDLWDDLRPLLDRELNLLPDKYRLPVVLCDLEGRTRAEAARQLGWPEGTVAGRLARARQMLARRMSSRGMILSGAALAGMLAHEAAASVPAALATTTTEAALALATGSAVTSAGAVKLAEGVVKAMLLQKIGVVAVLFLALSLAVLTGGLLAGGQTEGEGAPKLKVTSAPAAPGQVAKKESPTKAKDTVWTLDFQYKNARLVTVAVPGQGEKNICYLCYSVANNSDQEHTFIPDFDLVIDEKTHHDQVIPAVQAAISKIEDPTQELKIENSVTIATAPLAPAALIKPGTPKGIHGVALWPDVAGDAKGFTVYVGGLSNVWIVDGKVVKRKTLKLTYVRDGKEMKLAGKAEWVFRPAKLEVAKADQVSLQGAWQVTSVEAEGKHLGSDLDKTQRWVITGDRITIHYSDGSKDEFTYMLDPTKKPKVIDLTVAAGHHHKDNVFPGIYELDGDKLTVHRTTGGERPTKFEIDFVDRGHIQYTLKRIKQEPGKGAAVSPKDQAALAGAWRVASLENDGLKLGEGRPEIKDARAVINFAGGMNLFSLLDKNADGQNVSNHFVFELDTTKKPNVIRLTSFASFKFEVLQGIYEVTGDTLKLCFVLGLDAKPPTDFSAPAGSKRSQYVFKREKTATEKTAAEELKKLDGVWEVVNDDAFINAVGVQRTKGARWTIAQGQLTFDYDQGLAPINRFFRTLAVDPTKKPASLAITNVLGPDGGTPLFVEKGIYALEGDQLKISLATGGEKPPTEFPAKPKPGQLIVLKRVQPKQAKANGLSARIEVKTKNPVAKAYFDAELILTNDTDKPLRLCKLVGVWWQRDEGAQKWLEANIRPDNQPAKFQPSAEQSSGDIITLQPGKSVALPFRPECQSEGKFTLKAMYSTGDAFAKKHNTWSGEVAAEPVTVQVGAASGLSARIELKTKNPVAGTRITPDLVLTNESTQPIRVCTFCGGFRSGSSDGAWHDEQLAPDWWKSDSPSPEMSAKKIVTLQPGKSVTIPFSVYLIPNAKGEITLKASYATGKAFAQKHNTWSGEVKAKPVTISFANAKWSGDNKELKESKLKIDLAPANVKLSNAGQVLRTKQGLNVPMNLVYKSGKAIKVNLIYQEHGGVLLSSDMYVSLTAVEKKTPEPFWPAYLPGKASPKSPMPLTLTGGESLNINLLLGQPDVAAGQYKVRFLLLFEADGVRQYVIGPETVITVPPEN